MEANAEKNRLLDLKKAVAQLLVATPEKCRMFVFSDAPHIMKCVRNRSHSQEVLIFYGSHVQWSHYDKLFVENQKQPGPLRVCPQAQKCLPQTIQHT